MQVLISDANILIDIEEGELLEEMFKLPYIFSIPDILFYEEMEEEHEHLIGLGLRLDELSGQTLKYGIDLTQQYKKPSRNDCFALALAKQEKCPLLTGDRDLRIAAENEAVVVVGTIWLITQLVQHELITAELARIAYDKMKDAGRRLPWDKAELKLRELNRI
ncbi:PIN domain-containing protein [uncultured Paraglaciecola sp.]|uniref:PIN domain-containing protein n=1 Tax=uncultured Paraglaciecola sp. TaxID=1765024 RepID=UPI0030D9D452|tara:strand:- start:94443 stop:94931 length:489 start_codon:yes stop_codon:yes gene_type:complete